MTHLDSTRERRLLPAAASLLVLAAAGAGVMLAGPACGQDQREPLKAEADEPVGDRVRKLLDEAMSDDARLRERAERDIVALGEPARAELDRLTRDADPKRAIAALKLLQSDQWERRERRVAREKQEREHGFPEVPDIDLREFQEQIDRRMEEMRRRMAEWEKDIDWDAWMPQVDASDPLPPGGTSSGTVVENDKRFAWTIDGTGKVKITVKDGQDAAEKVYEAPSVEALRKDHPEIASRLDKYAPQRGTHRIVLRWPRGLQGDERSDPLAQPGARPALRDGEERLAPRPGADPLAREPGRAPVPAGPTLGVMTGEVPDVLREQLDVPQGGLVVESVLPDTLAARLGIRRNDVLLRVAGQDVASAPDVRKALGAVAAGADLQVEVIRKGRRETLTAKR
jgi:hypothetical protein